MREEREKETFAKAKNGSKLHLNYLIEVNYPIVFRYIYRLTFNKELSEDIAQETSIKFIVNLKKFEYKAKVSTLMIAMASNLLKDHYKKTKPLSLNETISIEIKDDRHSEAKELLMRLDVETRKMFVLKYYHGYNYREIGEILSVPEGTIKSRFHYAIKQIRLEEVSEDG
jgi:RNA polymerase sigma-70 factor (ECF subfamily)